MEKLYVRSLEAWYPEPMGMPSWPRDIAVVAEKLVLGVVNLRGVVSINFDIVSTGLGFPIWLDLSHQRS